MVLSRKRRDHSEYNAIYLITGRKRDRRETPSVLHAKGHANAEPVESPNRQETADRKKSPTIRKNFLIISV